MTQPMKRRKFLLGSLAMAIPRPEYRIIDPHVHVWVNDPHYPWPKETTEPPKKDATPAMLLELMKANHVERTVLVQPIFYRWDNRYVADSMRKYAPYFQAVCRVNPIDPAAPDYLSKLTEQGFRGVRLSPAADASGDCGNAHKDGSPGRQGIDRLHPAFGSSNEEAAQETRLLEFQ